MKPELILPDQIDPVGGQGRNFALEGEGMAPVHIVTGGHLHEEILFAVSFKGLEHSEIVRKNDEPLTPLLQGLDQVEILVAVSVGDDPTEIGISLGGPDQHDRPVTIGRKLTPHNGLDAYLLGCLEKKDQSVQTVGIGKGESMHPLFLSGPAEFFNGTDAPAFGIVGMDVKMDKIHGILSPAHSIRLSSQRSLRQLLIILVMPSLSKV